MTNLRPALFVILVFLGYMLWVEWQKDYGPQRQEPAVPELPAGSADTPPTADLPSVGAGDLPVARAESQPADGVTGSGPAQETEAARLIHITTDVLKLEIDPVGGTVVSAWLLDYPVDLEQPEAKVQLFNRTETDLYVAQSGLLSRAAAPNHTTPYDFEREAYRLSPGDEALVVPLTWSDESGLTVTKSFVIRPGRYDIAVRHTLHNGSAEAWSGSGYEQLQRALPHKTSKSGFNNPERYSFKGLGFYGPEEKLTKVTFEDVSEEPYERSEAGGWLAMIEHYFFSAWIPPSDETVTYSSQEYAPQGHPRYIARAVSPAVAVAPGESHEFSSLLYVGPKLQEHLEDLAPGMGLTVNYGIFTVLSAPLFWLLSKIHILVGNWGWAIVLLTILIKGAFFKLTETQYRSMARMRKLQPRIEKLKERYGEDRQAMSQAMMQMYKEEKVNPLGGCLPVLIQIPFFIALYWVLLESVELRQAPFILWINNLSVRDPYFILPALNAIFMITTQRLTPMVGMDPMQRKMMQAMPVVFAVMFAFFPAGLVLYWATNAGLSLAQQWYITRKIAGDS